MIKLIATDLDGTLFYPKRKLTLMTRKNAEFLKDFYHAGGKVVLVTGRNYLIASKVEHKLGIPISIVGCNGSFVYENGKYVETFPMDNEKVFNMYNYLKGKFGIGIWMVFDSTDSLKITVQIGGKIIQCGAIIGNALNFSYAEKFINGEKPFINAITNNTLYKLMPVFGINKEACKNAAQAKMALEDLYGNDFTIVQSKNAMEITKKGVNKADSLKKYLELIGVKEDEVAVIGDSENDITMFDNFKNSFVMSHAKDFVKAKANTEVEGVFSLRDYVLTEDGKLK